MKIQHQWKGLSGKMKTPLFKSTLREIKGSLGRFLSIFFIVTLGVSFFSGINASAPDMKATADRYFDKYNLMDLQIMSTLGLDEEDIKAIEDIDEVKAVMKGYSLDAIAVRGNSQSVLRVHGIPLDKSLEDDSYINRPRLMEGRLPEKSGECVVEEDTFGKDFIKLGDTIKLSLGSDSDIKESLKTDEYKVVGVVNSPYYSTYEKGNSNIGSGKISQYIMVPEDDFSLPVYTEANVILKGAKELFTYGEDYEKLRDDVSKKIEAIGTDRAKLRYDDIIKEANKTLDEKKKEYEEGKLKAETELKKALDKIEDGSKNLDEGEKQLKLKEQQVGEALDLAKEKLKDAEVDLKIGKAQYEMQLQNFNEKKAEAETQLEAAKKAIAEGEALIEKQEKELIDLKAKLEDPSISGIEKEKIKLQIQNIELTLSYAKPALEKAKVELASKEAALKDGEAKLNAAKATLDASESKLKEEKAKLLEGEAKSKAEFEKARRDIENGRSELAKGREEYEKNKISVESTLKDGNDKILDAEEKIKSIEEPSWYVLNRDMNYGYVSYEDSADRVKAIARVFPVFFFLVAALVCLTTMTRMVDEQRIDIGTLKALGYDKKSIASKYILYAALASIGGSILGLAVGFILFPTVIFDAYGIMFTVPDLILQFNVFYAAIATLAAVLTTTLAALSACYKELKETPALLMIPKAPKVGKKILLERWDFIWKRLKFTEKVTARNIFRYKKRFLMTVLGISGCTALILAGFGIKDSIQAIIDIEYGEIITYDMSAALDSNIKTEDENGLREYFKNNDKIEDSMMYKTKNTDVIFQDESKEASLIIPEDVEKFKEFHHLRVRTSQKEVSLDEGGVVLAEKLAKELGVKKGDTITIKDENNKRISVPVTGIVENYVSHYVFMSRSTYESLYERDFKGNEVVAKVRDTSKALEDDISKELLEKDGVTGVYFNSGVKAMYGDTIKSLNYVVIVMILAAGALAFVVLYNLTNVNISERIREIATIKVLGFYDKEVSAYVYKENILLTIIGILVGLALGVVLHRFIMVTAEPSDIMFGRTIGIFSYIYAFGITMAFSALVNWAMYYKLKAVKMVESLKSVD